MANQKFILDIDCKWPGSTHDSRVWRLPDVKEYIETEGLAMIPSKVNDTFYSQGFTF